MSIMPNEPPVRLAPAPHWNSRNELTGWGLLSGTRHLLTVMLLFLCFLRHECFTDDLYYSLSHSELVSLMCFIHLTISVPFSPPYIKQTKGWVMVSESRLSFINGFRLSGVSGWWIVRMSCNGCGSLSCDVLFVPSENTCVIQCLVQLIITL